MTSELPAGLASAIAERGAAVERVEAEGARRYVTAGAWFGRCTTDPADEASLAHEVAVRAVVGTALPLRAPEIVASGPGWTLERALPRTPPAGALAVRATIAAALAIPRLALPEPPAGPPEPGGARWRRRARMLRSGLRPRDVLRARRDPGLPLAVSHGDFHAGNVLCDDAGPWVVDWELAGEPRPLGYDLLTLWPTLADPADRELVLEAALWQAGPAHRRGVLRLHHALLVRALAAVAGAPRGVGGVGPGARELRALLAEARA